jgi:hypothetical protein
MSNRLLPKQGRFRFFFDRSNYTVVPGGTATVTIFVQETFKPRDEESLLAPGTDGLIRAGVVVQVGAPLPNQPAFVRTTAAILGNPGFDLAVVARMPSVESPGNAGIVELSTKPVFGEVVSRSPNCETVLLPLGTFTFTAGKVLGDVTSLTALVTADYPETCSENNVTDSGVVLDELIEPGIALIVVSQKPPEAIPSSARSVADMLAAMSLDTVRLKK